MKRGTRTKEVFSIRLSKFEKKELSQISKQVKAPIGQLIKESIDRFIAVKRFKQLRKTAITYARAKGVYSNNDALQIFEKNT